MITKDQILELLNKQNKEEYIVEELIEEIKLIEELNEAVEGVKNGNVKTLEEVKQNLGK